MLKFAFLVALLVGGLFIWRTLDPASVARLDAKAAAKIERADATRDQQPAQPEQPALTGLEMQACAAVKEAILDWWKHPPTATFGECSAAQAGSTDYAVTVVLHFPPGPIRSSISYHATAAVDAATGKIRPITDLVHD